eukprot:TRINITY_DN22454_c0_g1_i6.p1 TRINITY_DN22454_c0_g1~~TRINITY_DN22454_c0_g1_i6.p1  ORF type:complete len:449 (-),score=10.33 TRINITY_DN22454_c0_g1_i6:231-1577(-)
MLYCGYRAVPLICRAPFLRPQFLSFSKMPGGNKVPDRWSDYTRIGKVVKGTRFICFKVPLKASILNKLPEDERNWGLAELLQTENLGLVIDLTYTSRYYSPKNVEDSGIKHAKIMTMGHEIPKRKVVGQFYETVDKFLQEEESKLIGVHCTHGLNRTGYLVCRYMIEKLGINPEEAIKDFEEARGHKQERENYLEHLRGKGWETESNEIEEDSPDVNNKRKSRHKYNRKAGRSRRDASSTNPQEVPSHDTSEKTCDETRREEGDSWPDPHQQYPNHREYPNSRRQPAYKGYHSRQNSHYYHNERYHRPYYRYPNQGSNYSRGRGRKSDWWRDDSHGYRDDSHRYRNDSHGYRDDSHRYRNDSHGYRDDSHGYRNDSHGYRDDSNGYGSNSNGYRYDSHGYRNDNSGYQDSRSGHGSQSDYNQGQSRHYDNRNEYHNDRQKRYHNDQSW